MITTKLLKAFFFAVILAVAVVGVAMAAGSVILEGYQLDFIEVIQDGNNSTWVYAITSSGDEASALSHWTLQINNCGYTIVSPDASIPYTTPTSYTPQSGPYAGTDICDADGPYDCASANYDVEYGHDSTTNLSGIKFQDADAQLSSGNQVTHIFAITLHNEFETRIGDTLAGIKVGGSKTEFETGLITGAVCAPTAVDMLALSANTSMQSYTLLPIALASAVLLLAVLMWVRLQVAHQR